MVIKVSDIFFKRGPLSRLPKLRPGEPALTTDTEELYVGTSNGNIRVGGKIPPGLAQTFVSVKDYGAKGDGTANDTTAIQNAINEMGTRGGGVVFFPRGHYRTSATITVNADYVTLLGEGCYASYISPLPGHTNHLIYLGNVAGPWRWGISVKEIGVRNSLADGIYMKNNLQWKLEGVDARNCAGNGIYGHTAWVGRLLNSYMYNNGGSGFYADFNCHALSILGSHFISNEQYGIYAPEESSLTGNTFETSTLADIFVDSTKDGVFIAGNYFEGGRTGGSAIHVKGTYVTLDTNGIGGQPVGIKLEGAKHVKVINNSVGLSVADLAYNNLQTLYVDGSCRNIEIDQVGTLTIEPGAVITDKPTVKDYLYPFGEFTSLTAGVPKGWVKETATISSALVPSFAGECANALKVTTSTAHDRFSKLITGLKPSTIYTFGALISMEDVGAVEFRNYNLSQTILAGQDEYWSANFKRGHFLVTVAFTSTAGGTAEIQFGSPYLGTFLVEWVSVLEGYYTEQTFPRKSNRKNHDVFQSANGSYYRVSVNDAGAFVSSLLT